MNRAALYMRVSTDEQSHENQYADLRRLMKQRKLMLAGSYVEKVSAVKQRPVFQAMLKDAHAGKFDCLLIWALDRFGRSMAGNLNTVLELDRRGVRVVSVREPWLDTTGPVRDLLVAIFSWVAEQERAQLIARTNAGLERARSKGVRLGRPPSTIDVRTARNLVEGGMSLRQAAKRFGVGVATLHRMLRRSTG